MKNFKKLYVLAFLALGLTSCLEDKEFEDQKYGMLDKNPKKIIEITSRSRALSLDNVDETVAVTVVPIHLSASEVAAEDITVTLSIDQTQTMINAYNTANGASLVALPADLYEFPEGLTVTIPKGSRDAVLQLETNSRLLNADNVYALGFTITNVDKPGYTISGNYNGLLTRFAVKNIYHGTYMAEGVFVHPTAGPRDIHHEKEMTTVNASTSRVELGDLAGANYYMYVKVNPDNSVDILPDPSAVAGAQDVYETGVNSYDPATKTFTLNYAYNKAAPRIIKDEKLVRVE